MAKIIVEVCEICRKESCDGKKYRIKDMFGVKIVCKSDPSVGFHDEKLMYLFVRGHGEYAYYDLEEV